MTQRLWALMVSAALLIGWTCGLGFLNTIRFLLTSMFSPQALRLALLVGLSAVLAHVLDKAGFLEQLLHLLRQRVRRPSAVASITATAVGMVIISPGGAQTSAIMIKPLTGDGLAIAAAASINVWFRVLGRFLVPFMPSLVLIAEMGGQPPWRVFLAVLAFALIYAAFGYFLLVRQQHPPKTTAVFQPSTKVWPWYWVIAPFATVFVIALLGVSTMLALLAGLVTTIIAVRFVQGVWIPSRIVWQGIQPHLILFVMVIVAFGAMLVETGLVIHLAKVLPLQGGAWVRAMIVVGLPLALGFLLNNMMGTVAVVLPLLMPFWAGAPLLLQLFCLAAINVSANVGSYLLAPHNIDFHSARAALPAGIGSLYRSIFIPLLGSLACYLLLLSNFGL
ncbi:MAG TPA: hypothetical protein GXZ96_05595 [Firmicutes bacterium]|nr:hypothetical protein [Bacillota bacterium]